MTNMTENVRKTNVALQEEEEENYEKGKDKEEKIIHVS